MSSRAPATGRSALLYVCSMQAWRRKCRHLEIVVHQALQLQQHIWNAHVVRVCHDGRHRQTTAAASAVCQQLPHVTQWWCARRGLRRFVTCAVCVGAGGLHAGPGAEQVDWQLPLMMSRSSCVFVFFPRGGQRQSGGVVCCAAAWHSRHLSTPTNCPPASCRHNCWIGTPTPCRASHLRLGILPPPRSSRCVGRVQPVY